MVLSCIAILFVYRLTSYSDSINVVIRLLMWSLRPTSWKCYVSALRSYRYLRLRGPLASQPQVIKLCPCPKSTWASHAHLSGMASLQSLHGSSLPQRAGFHFEGFLTGHNLVHQCRFSCGFLLKV